MSGVALKVKDLELDQKNPRITKSSSQRETLQKIIDDQDLKLVVLAESIAEDGLNPMDRWLVTKSDEHRNKYTVLEGNRRLAAIMILTNVAVLNDLEVRGPVKKRFQVSQFDVKDLEPIDCFEVDDRKIGVTWINQRHTGQNMGRGIVNWDGSPLQDFAGAIPHFRRLSLSRSRENLLTKKKKMLPIAFQFPR